MFSSFGPPPIQPIITHMVNTTGYETTSNENLVLELQQVIEDYQNGNVTHFADSIPPALANGISAREREYLTPKATRLRGSLTVLCWKSFSLIPEDPDYASRSLTALFNALTEKQATRQITNMIGMGGPSLRSHHAQFDAFISAYYMARPAMMAVQDKRLPIFYAMDSRLDNWVKVILESKLSPKENGRFLTNFPRSRSSGLLASPQFLIDTFFSSSATNSTKSEYATLLLPHLTDQTDKQLVLAKIGPTAQTSLTAYQQGSSSGSSEATDSAAQEAPVPSAQSDKVRNG